MQIPSRPRLLAVLLLPLWGACAAPAFDARAVAMEWAAYMQRDYAVQPGDTLAIMVYPADPAMPGQQVIVPPTGKVLLARLPEPIQVAGRTMPVLSKELDRSYRAVFAGEIHVQVSLAALANPTIYIAGEVRSGGAQPYRPGMTLSQAVATAGGLAITAKASDVRILRNVPEQPPRTIRVDLESILYDSAPDFLLLPGDVVYCQTSAIADVDNWVDLYIRRMIPLPIAPLF